MPSGYAKTPQQVLRCEADEVQNYTVSGVRYAHVIGKIELGALDIATFDPRRGWFCDFAYGEGNAPLVRNAPLPA